MVITKGLSFGAVLFLCTYCTKEGGIIVIILN